ncbi:RNA-directed DNA polymerase, eukaryota [Tanacetum coccineum]
MIDGIWIDNPIRVKDELFQHFSNRFDKPNARRAHIEMRYPKNITCDQQADLERDVSYEEIKREYFLTYGVIPKGCNSSFIALIPKSPGANTVKDFRPISLIGSVYKIIAKILANRLVGVLGDIVNEVQSAFIADRQILDGPFILNEVLQCKSKIMGIHVVSDKVKSAATKLRCLILKTPFLYLGSKVGGSMSRVQAWTEVVDRVKSRLSKWKMKALSIGGRYPRLFNLETCKSITVSMKLAQPGLGDSFRRTSRSGVEQAQFDELSALLQNVTVSTISDRWNWVLESLGDFSVASVRKAIDDKLLPEVDSKTRWIKYVPIKVNVHAWKVKTDSLPTRFNISRRGIDIESITCDICDNGVETSSHLFFSCCMVRQIGCIIVHWWDIPYVEVDSHEEWISWLVNLQISSKHKLMIEGVLYVMWWHLWSFRNKLMFDVKTPPNALFF